MPADNLRFYSKTDMRIFTLLGCLLLAAASHAQSALTIREIMKGQEFTGYWPERARWSEDSKTVYFDWNPEMNAGDSLYKYEISAAGPVKVSRAERQQMPASTGEYNAAKTKKVYSKNGDIFLYELKTGKTVQLTNTTARESDPYFGPGERTIHFTSENNLFSWDAGTGTLTQLTDFRSGFEKKEKAASEQDSWLKQDQLGLSEVIKQKSEDEKLAGKVRKSEQPSRPGHIYLEGHSVSDLRMSPDGKYISYTFFKAAENTKNTMVPVFVTESGYTEPINTRTKVGSELSKREVWLYRPDLEKKVRVKTADLPGIKDKPDYFKDYPKLAEREEEERQVFSFGPFWSADGRHAVMIYRSADNKDRWITLLNPNDGSNTLLDRQRDEAWIGGPGVGWSMYSPGEIGWLPDNKRFWFQSEETGFSHLYTIDVETGKKTALTAGQFEVYDPFISRDKTRWYFSSNEGDSGQRHFYQMPIEGGQRTRITSMQGSNQVALSPDEKNLAILHSTANQPWELFVMPNKAGAVAKKVTESTTPEFREYEWRVPEFISFSARDGAKVPARLYRPANATAGGPAVIFVHGAGYLQNAHKWWSSYFREYMFHNFLADNGYTVLDIDYRASAGYGRDWRTAIYRHMGGWDLSDHVDGASYLVEELGIAGDKIGIYGGSYGGFITLMALFNEPDVFAAGAALRSVTDWAHYNHGYTANILNTPVLDSLAYRRSSPIYYAEGLTKPLLIAHGMVDTNVHFQDVVRLAQRLIELGKEDWEMAVYPVENHGFVEPSSWADEYRRIFELFEEHLK